MSYCEIRLVNNKGYIEEVSELKNSWGFCPFIWRKLFEKYIEKNQPYDNWLLDEGKRVFSLFKDCSIPRWERAVLGSTFDHVIIKLENLNTLAEYYDKFIIIYQKNSEFSHLQEMSNVLRNLTDKSCKDYIGIHFYSSVAEDTFNRFNFETNWFLFDELLDL